MWSKQYRASLTSQLRLTASDTLKVRELEVQNWKFGAENARLENKERKRHDLKTQEWKMQQ